MPISTRGNEAKKSEILRYVDSFCSPLCFLAKYENNNESPKMAIRNTILKVNLDITTLI